MSIFDGTYGIQQQSTGQIRSLFGGLLGAGLFVPKGTIGNQDAVTRQRQLRETFAQQQIHESGLRQSFPHSNVKGKKIEIKNEIVPYAEWEQKYVWF